MHHVAMPTQPWKENLLPERLGLSVYINVSLAALRNEIKLCRHICSILSTLVVSPLLLFMSHFFLSLLSPLSLSSADVAAAARSCH